jgi:hypothetical protein
MVRLNFGFTHWSRFISIERVVPLTSLDSNMCARFHLSLIHKSFLPLNWWRTQPLSPHPTSKLSRWVVGWRDKRKRERERERKDLGFCIRRVKDVAVRQGWHPYGVVPKRNSRFGPNPSHPIKDWKRLFSSTIANEWRRYRTGRTSPTFINSKCSYFATSRLSSPSM